MARSINQVILMGNLGADPEIRNFPNGGRVANLRIATTETWKDRSSGERQEKTQWHNVAIFAKPLIDLAERYLRKGSKVYLQGQLEHRKWHDKNGQARWTTEIVLRPYSSNLVLLDRPSNASRNSYEDSSNTHYASRPPSLPRQHTVRGRPEDNVPF